MKVLSALPLGRLGNVIFRYLAMVVFSVINDADIIDPNTETPNIVISDESFVALMDLYLANMTTKMNKEYTYGFVGYFQHDKIYLKYKEQIVDYIRQHPNDCLMTDGKTATRNDFAYDTQYYKAIELLEHPTGDFPIYNVVVHLRLEDFIDNGSVIHPSSVLDVLKAINSDSYCIVVNNPKTELEMKYIEYLKQHYSITIVSNDVITDFHTMKHAKTLVCSRSTLSWAAAFFSSTVQQVYMPNYYMGRPHETFRKPIENTTLYYYRQCTRVELEAFLARN